MIKIKTDRQLLEELLIKINNVETTMATKADINRLEKKIDDIEEKLTKGFAGAVKLSTEISQQMESKIDSIFEKEHTIKLVK